MARPIQIETGMQMPHRELPFTSASRDEIDEKPSISARDPDIMLILILLLLACIALALLADAII